MNLRDQFPKIIHTSSHLGDRITLITLTLLLLYTPHVWLYKSH